MEDSAYPKGCFKDPNQVFSVLKALNHQRLTPRLCDVVLRIFDTQIYAHACVLAAASPYFDEIFGEHDGLRVFCPKTPQIIEIQIDGLADPAYRVAVEKVVAYMYTSEIYLESGMLTQVQEIAKIMQLNDVLGRYSNPS